MERPVAGAPGLVVSDLDGTFLLPDGTVGPQSRDVLARCADAGLRVTFATGRPPRWLGVLEGLPMVEPVVVASNGALLWDLRTGRAVRRHDVPGDVAAQVIDDVRRVVPDAAFAIEQGLRCGFEPAYTSPATDAWTDDPEFFRAPVEELCAEPFVKLLVQSRELDADRLAEVVAPVVAGRLTVTHSSPGGVGLLEVSAPGVTKAGMIAAYASSLGMGLADVAAFGDMPNDYDMLDRVGRAFVMAHAHPALAGLDATRIGSNADGAVAATIARWLA